MSGVLRITAWDSTFEIAQSRREVKRSDESGKQAHYSWVAMPTKRGSGYDAIVMGHPQGISHFGCWVVLLEIAANCKPRGTLIRSSHGPAESPGHDAESLAIAARVPVALMADALRRLIGIGWLEVVPSSLGGYSDSAQPTGQDITGPTLQENISASDEARVADGDSFSLVEPNAKPERPDPRLAWFTEFWEAYRPIRSKARKAALKAFTKIVRSEAVFHAVMTGLQQQTAELLSRSPEHRPYCSSWLNGARYEDEAAEVDCTRQAEHGSIIGRAIDASFEEG